MIYIGRDGLERNAPDIPSLSTHIRGGDIVPSTLVRATGDEPWRRAETDPNIAALLALGHANTVQFSPITSRIGVIIAKTVFLLLAFFISIILPVTFIFFITMYMFHGALDWNGKLPYLWVLGFFMPAILATRDRSFTIWGKAKRFALSQLLVSTLFTISVIVLEVALVLLRPLDGWALSLIACLCLWAFVFFGLKRIWHLSTVLEAMRLWRRGKRNSLPVSGGRPEPSTKERALDTPATKSVGEGRSLPPDVPDDVVWRTLLEYDEPFRQTVERLTALSPENVEVFRRCLLAGRDYARLKECEDASIAEVQAPAFVDDEALQKAYIYLRSLAPSLGDQFVQTIRIIGKPDDVKTVTDSILAKEEPFEKFWRMFPQCGKSPGSKEPVREEFDRLVSAGVSPDHLIYGATQYRAYLLINKIDENKIKKALMWLGNKEYDLYAKPRFMLERPSARRRRELEDGSVRSD
jgi:hypothetical protein